ncbi:MAG: ATP-dependent DNA helicase RecG [Capnocytophaga sp.]|nr:ATP-dependent DNA helicase RecG [Capnocytophaga sp.]
MDKLLTPIEYLKGVGTQRAELLKSELGIKTYQDLVHLFPNRYIDRTKYYKISELSLNNTEVQLVGKIINIRMVEGKTKAQNRLMATFSDGDNTMDLVWFRPTQWIKEHLLLNVPYVIFGRCNFFNGTPSMPHPEMETLEDHERNLFGNIQPIYPSSEKLTKRGITNKFFRKLIETLFTETGNIFYETLPVEILENLKLLSKGEAIFNIHFPQNQEFLAKAQFRLKLEELFYIQIQLVQKNLLNKRIKGFRFEKVGDYFNDFYHKFLPFPLTNAQKRVIKEIRNDIGIGAQMNRLLQGDVGAGKTIVALISMLFALDNSFQACLIAPTEILATQHFHSILDLLKNMNIKVALLTGSTKIKERREIHKKLESGDLQILIGTHAVLEDKVQFHNLGLAVIDEQHRFGVEQRSKLWKKNTIPPHILVMSATPIPRTLAMSLYGDLDVSVIDELPPGRKPIKTLHLYDTNRSKIYQFIYNEIEKGRQVYVVYPLIEESKVLDYKNLAYGFEQLVAAFPLPKYQIAMVHGQMKPAEKDAEMQRFIEGKAQIMVATTVIEVGVNVPNASVMIIESAERFGLSQLHQLRGRVGRGAEQSYCVLVTDMKLSSDSRTRMETMVATNDGFQIAEVDLKLRGPGDLMGTRQSGVLNLKIADIVKDSDILKVARSYAIDLMKIDPNLTKQEHQNIAYTLEQLKKSKGIWNYIS